MVVDVETLMIMAVKEMMVDDSKQSAVLRHELGVLHPQLQPDVRIKGGRGPSYRRSSRTSIPHPPQPAADSSGSTDRTPFFRRRPKCSGSSSSGKSSGTDGEESTPPERRGPCPYMPRYYGSFVPEDPRPCVSIVLEHIPGVDLARWIEDSGPEHSPPPEPWLACVCRDLVEALRYLHARKLVHRDVKPANVLLTPTGAKLADFGSTIEEDEGPGHRMHGTIRFMSPERLWDRQYRPSSDLWAAGLTIAAAALGENPIPHCSTEFDAVDHARVAFEKVAAHPRASRLSPQLLDFLEAVLVADPDKRLTAEQMLEHPFVKQAFAVSDGSGDGDDLLGFMRGGFLDGRKRRAERVSPSMQEEKEEKASGAGGACACKVGTGSCVGGSGARSGTGSGSCCKGSRNSNGGVSDTEWKDEVQRRLRRLRSKHVPRLDPSDVARNVLQARRKKGNGVEGLEKLDFSHLASELGIGVAELRSQFGSVASNMEGCNTSGSWSSPAPSTGSSELMTGNSGRNDEPEQERPPDPPMRPSISTNPSSPPSPSRKRPPDSPQPRRRPPPLTVSPHRPERRMLRSLPTSPTGENRAPSPVRGMSAVLFRPWPGRNRRRSNPRSLDGVEEEGEQGRYLGKDDASGGDAGGRNGPWWKRGGRRLRHIFKGDKSKPVTIVVEPGTTELPSPRPEETPSALGTPFNSRKLPEEEPRSRGGDVASVSVSRVERSGASVGKHGLGRAPGIAGQHLRRPFEDAVEDLRIGVCDGPAPAWGPPR